MTVNMCVWESIEHLQQYVYRTAHAMMLRNRKEWFEAPNGPSHAMWWISAGVLELGLQRNYPGLPCSARRVASRVLMSDSFGSV